ERGEGVGREARPGGVEVWPVNPGGVGLRVTVRWMLSPDRRAILVVHDPVSVEADPIPDGFLYANEATGAIVRMSSVWDVAPSPDWTRLAYGRAYVLNARERDTMPEEEWRRVEAQLPEDVADRRPGRLRRELEARAFPASSMARMDGLGLTQVIWLDRLGAGRAAAPTGPTHSLYGWRVRWTPNGDTLGVGTVPKSTYDDAPPAHWLLVRARFGASYRDSLGITTDSSRFARLSWVEGPTMELANPVDLTRRQVLAINGGSIDARDDSIRVTTHGRDGRTEVRVVGPGIPLAATASGRFVAALVPGPMAQERPQGMPAQLVVYHIPLR
ncbi:MAG: hypothetical protein M3282_11360, partial [Gemmatimonadota bacterium]|nr:hypothetical protein [Gemmatimonadota bacterium]